MICSKKSLNPIFVIALDFNTHKKNAEIQINHLKKSGYT